MKITDIDTYLRNYTAKERHSRSGIKAGLDGQKEYRRYREYRDDTGEVAKEYLFQDVDFLKSGESMGIYKQDRFEVVYPHAHNYIELNYIWAGTFGQVINGERQVCVEGTLCILDTNSVHSIEPAGEGDILINLLMRKEFFAAAFFNRMTKQGILTEFLADSILKQHNEKHYLLFETGGNGVVRHAMEQLIKEYVNDDLGKIQIMDSYVVILFHELLRIYQQNGQWEASPGKERQKVYRILEYIEKNYEHCTLESVAGHFGFNSKYLTMMLKEKTGRSFVEHLQSQRLNKAKMLLEHSDIPVSGVITLCGYQNQNFFYKKFKEAEGCTPGEYRERVKQCLYNT